MSLLNSFTKAARGKVHLTALSLSLVVTQPVLQQRGVERRRTQAIEAESLTSMHHGELTSQSEDGALGGRVGELRGGCADEGDDGGGVDDGSLGLVVAAECEDGVLAAEPDALDVDVVGEVPDGLGGVDGVVVVGVHDAGVVEDDVEAAPAVEGLDHGLDVSLLGDVAFLQMKVSFGFIW